MIAAVVLAAGKSTRMGRTKALLPVAGGDTFITHIIRSFVEAGVDDIVVVLGHDPAPVAAALVESQLPARVVVNREYESGQLSSVQKGLEAIDRPGVDAMLLTLVDVPLTSPATIRAVIERYRATGAPVVRPVSDSRHGHPVLIDRRLFAEVREADPNCGVKPIVRSHASAAGDVQVEDEGAFLDVDTPGDYGRVIRKS
jgi:molybdenum cofactor cytidylyltransferase